MPSNNRAANIRVKAQQFGDFWENWKGLLVVTLVVAAGTLFFNFALPGLLGQIIFVVLMVLVAWSQALWRNRRRLKSAQADAEHDI